MTTRIEILLQGTASDKVGTPRRRKNASGEQMYRRVEGQVELKNCFLPPQCPGLVVRAGGGSRYEITLRYSETAGLWG